MHKQINKSSNMLRRRAFAAARSGQAAVHARRHLSDYYVYIYIYVYLFSYI